MDEHATRDERFAHAYATLHDEWGVAQHELADYLQSWLGGTHNAQQVFLSKSSNGAPLTEKAEPRIAALEDLMYSALQFDPPISRDDRRLSEEKQRFYTAMDTAARLGYEPKDVVRMLADETGATRSRYAQWIRKASQHPRAAMRSGGRANLAQLENLVDKIGARTHEHARSEDASLPSPSQNPTTTPDEPDEQTRSYVERVAETLEPIIDHTYPQRVAKSLETLRGPLAYPLKPIADAVAKDIEADPRTIREWLKDTMRKPDRPIKKTFGDRVEALERIVERGVPYEKPTRRRRSSTSRTVRTAQSRYRNERARSVREAPLEPFADDRIATYGGPEAERTELPWPSENGPADEEKDLDREFYQLGHAPMRSLARHLAAALDEPYHDALERILAVRSNSGIDPTDPDIRILAAALEDYRPRRNGSVSAHTNADATEARREFTGFPDPVGLAHAQRVNAKGRVPYAARPEDLVERVDTGMRNGHVDWSTRRTSDDLNTDYINGVIKSMRPEVLADRLAKQFGGNRSEYKRAISVVSGSGIPQRPSARTRHVLELIQQYEPRPEDRRQAKYKGSKREQKRALQNGTANGEPQVEGEARFRPLYAELHGNRGITKSALARHLQAVFGGKVAAYRTWLTNWDHGLVTNVSPVFTERMNALEEVVNGGELLG